VRRVEIPAHRLDRALMRLKPRRAASPEPVARTAAAAAPAPHAHAATPGLDRRPCRWSPEGGPEATRLTRWVCAACGVEAFTTGSRAPRECKRGLRGPAL